VQQVLSWAVKQQELVNLAVLVVVLRVLGLGCCMQQGEVVMVHGLAQG
jgi:hypothetical protein